MSASRAGQPGRQACWSCSGVIPESVARAWCCAMGASSPLPAGRQRGADRCDHRLPARRQLRRRRPAPARAVGPNRRKSGRPRGAGSPGAVHAPLRRPGNRPARPASRAATVPPRPAELLLLLSAQPFRSHFAHLFGGEEAERRRFANAAPDDEMSEEEEEDRLESVGVVRAASRAAGDGEGGGGARAGIGRGASGTCPRAHRPWLAAPHSGPSARTSFSIRSAAACSATRPARCCSPMPAACQARRVEACSRHGPRGALVALVAALLCWKAREWVGLTLLCAAAPLLSVASEPPSTAFTLTLPPCCPPTA